MENKRFKRILLVVGASGESQRAAAAAIDLAILAGKAQLIALNVVDKASVNRMSRFTDKSPTELEVELEENGWKYLYRVEERAKDQGVPTMIMQASGVVEHEVVKQAGRLKIDLVVLGYPASTSGQARRLVQGHIEKILENVDCDVWVVR